MSEVKAKLSNYRQSPRKVRLVASLMRGKKVEEAITILSFIPKRAALPIQKLIASALANAKDQTPGKIAPENLIIKEIAVNAGPTLYRRRPRSHGMANPIRKRTSNISVTLENPASRKASQDKK